MTVILAIAAAVIVVVLLFTSKSYMEVPVYLIVFVAAAVLNMGTNFIFGTISFITNSIAVVLQLALAIDYAIIFCHRYMEERDNGLDARTPLFYLRGGYAPRQLPALYKAVMAPMARTVARRPAGTETDRQMKEAFAAGGCWITEEQLAPVLAWLEG